MRQITVSGLTPLQQHVMVAAWTEHQIGRNRHIPYGVFRSLVIKGLLMSADNHYELTSEGDAVIRDIAGKCL